MRPIIKQTPINEQGNLVTFSKYGDAKPFLVNQLGDYCSFCEKHNTRSALHVEHIYPKSKEEYAHLENEWSNFLLACVNCNSVKQTKDIAQLNPYMPHTDNLICYIEILEGGLIQVRENISEQEREKTIAFINLVGLDRIPSHLEKDDRWQYRYETYNIAQRKLAKYENQQTDIEDIIHLAQAKGFFSVWFSVFQAYNEVKSALINAFSGTAASCFDENNHYQPIPR